MEGSGEGREEEREMTQEMRQGSGRTRTSVTNNLPEYEASRPRQRP